MRVNLKEVQKYLEETATIKAKIKISIFNWIVLQSLTKSSNGFSSVIMQSRNEQIQRDNSKKLIKELNFVCQEVLIMSKVQQLITMKERKKIKYVQKQPPDKQNNDKQESTTIPPQNNPEPYQHKQHQHRPRQQQTQLYPQTYLIQQEKHHNAHQYNKYPNKQEENKTKYAAKEEQKYTTSNKYKEDRLPKQYRRSDYNRQEQLGVPPRFVQRQSSHPDICCIICSEDIKRKDYIWTCACCCISMHLRCIKEWIKNINQQQNKQNIHIFNWKCPQCNYEYNQPMPKYYCYCGKNLNPEYDRDLVSHSCGEICSKKRGPYCTHPCPNLCHPGKCPPCDYEGTLVNCQCGKSQRMLKCSEERLLFQCGKKCEKILNCHKHKCQRNCHAGPCQPCKKKKMVSCYCQKNTDIVDCSESSYSCGEVCGKQLDCGYHKCQMPCHNGDCNSCPHIPKLQTTCPCGKYSIQMLTGDPDFRKTCKDPIPVCGMPCGKKLDCGHVCPGSCHEGPCPNCKIKVDQSCQCGSIIRKIQCYQKQHHSFKCQLVCKKKRSCGNHLCNQVCCPHRNSPIPENHPCDLNCTKMLNCGKHQCGEPCHIGLCKKCPVIYSQPQPCPCGRTFLKPPIICGTLAPECNNICDKDLPCGHKCKLYCHYGNCKCLEEVAIPCRCGREQINTICGRQALCLIKCQNILSCGHKCSLQCHKGTCQQAHKQLPCRKICNKQRTDCNHLCPQLCHPGQKCQDFPCEAEILIKCECGHRQAMTLCGAKDNNKMKKAIVCNNKCQNLKRFDILYKGKEIYYPGYMVQFAFKNYPYLQNLEHRLQKFILRSDQNFLEIQYKFPDNYSKLLLTELFQNHYCLNTHFYRHHKYASFTLMQSDDTMIPKPVLSEYVKLISSGKIKQNNLPFEYTIGFELEQRDKIDYVIKSIKNFLHKYYTEKNGKFVSLHFWSKDDGEAALKQLEDEFQAIQFKCSINITKEEEEVAQSDIFQVGLEEPKEAQPQIAKQKKQDKVKIKEEVKEQRKVQPETVKQEAVKEEKEIKQIPVQTPEVSMGKKIPYKYEGGPKLIVRKNIPTFRKNDYPKSKENVQDIYLIDEQELFGQKIDWSNFVKTLCSKKMGPEASEWRIRTLLIISSFFKVEQHYFYEQFNSLVAMYNKDKEAAMRILEIQRIDNKSVKSDMDENGIYLSHHEPQMLSYLRFYNYLSEQKIPIEFPQILMNTPEITKSQQILEAVEHKKTKEFYQQIMTSDYVYSCSLIPLVHCMRQSIIESIMKGAKIAVKDLHKQLLFTSQQELHNYFQQNGLQIDTRMSKSTKEQIYVAKEGSALKEFVQNNNFTKEVVFEKRDKKYFLMQPEELYQDKYLILSFFAFGDFKESLSHSYMNSLVKLLKTKQ